MKKYQIVLVMYTRGNTMRDDVCKWNIESGLQAYHDCNHSQQESSFAKSDLTKLSINNYKYLTVLHALSDGWHLLAPPIGEGHYYSWWLTMSVEV